MDSNQYFTLFHYRIGSEKLVSKKNMFIHSIDNSLDYIKNIWHNATKSDIAC